MGKDVAETLRLLQGCDDGLRGKEAIHCSARLPGRHGRKQQVSSCPEEGTGPSCKTRTGGNGDKSGSHGVENRRIRLPWRGTFCGARKNEDFSRLQGIGGGRKARGWGNENFAGKAKILPHGRLSGERGESLGDAVGNLENNADARGWPDAHGKMELNCRGGWGRMRADQKDSFFDIMGFLPQFLTVSDVFKPEDAGAPSGCGVVLSNETINAETQRRGESQRGEAE